MFQIIARQPTFLFGDYTFISKKTNTFILSGYKNGNTEDRIIFAAEPKDNESESKSFYIKDAQYGSYNIFEARLALGQIDPENPWIGVFNYAVYTKGNSDVGLGRYTNNNTSFYYQITPLEKFDFREIVYHEDLQITSSGYVQMKINTDHKSPSVGPYHIDETYNRFDEKSAFYTNNGSMNFLLKDEEMYLKRPVFSAGKALNPSSDPLKSKRDAIYQEKKTEIPKKIRLSYSGTRAPANSLVTVYATIPYHNIRMPYTLLLKGVNTGKTVYIKGYWVGTLFDEANIEYSAPKFTDLKTGKEVFLDDENNGDIDLD